MYDLSIAHYKRRLTHCTTTDRSVHRTQHTQYTLCVVRSQSPKKLLRTDSNTTRGWC